MSGPRALYHMVRADFLERVRRYSFLLTLGFSLYLGYAVYTGYISVQVGNYRGVSNSAWLGSVMGLVASVFLSLVGFYIVKNAIQRDRETRVGQILVTTPMSKIFYTLSKTLSNFAVLMVMVLILSLAALIVQLSRMEDSQIHFFTLLSPILIFGPCALAVTAALAVLFETIPGLRGGFGNVIYFFVWIALLILGITTATSMHGFADYTGIVSVLEQMQARVHQLDPRSSGGVIFGGVGLIPNMKTFLWTGVRWNAALFLSRVLWFGIAVGLALLAAIFFDRFDTAREGRTIEKKQKPTGSLETCEPATASLTAPRRFVAPFTRLPPIGSLSAVRTRFLALVVAELRLLLRGHRWWWYVGGAGLFVACLVSPLAAARSGVIAAAWLWPVLLWSQMGTREAQFSTQSLIFSAQHAFPRQLLATWTAGVCVAVLTGGGLGLHLLLAKNFESLAAWTAGAFFIPALALALGVCTENRKVFEAFYTVWWYVGPLHHIPKLDFLGTTPGSSTPVLYLAASALLVMAACTCRGVRLAHQ